MAKGKGAPWTLREFWGKPVWDWLQLLGVLAIPVVIAVGGCMFNAQQDARQQQIEKQRAEAEQDLAKQRAQDEALQAYLDQMSTLLLEKDLRNPKDASEEPTLARARTLTILASLDEAHKRSVLQFLREAYLIQDGSCTWTDCDPVISLQDANLEGVDFGGTYTPLGGLVVDLRGAILFAADLTVADLQSADLTDANLEQAVLRDADLRGATLADANLADANLSGADLRGADLGGAWMSGTDLTDADLRGAFLWPSGAEMSGADLRGADLRRADLRDAVLLEADLRGATLSRVGAVPFAVLKGADLRNADLSNTDLTDADLRGAILRGANLSGANLNGTNLGGADLGAFLDPHGGELRGANLEGANGVTKEQLEAAKSLQGATMPNGQKYEDWLLPAGKWDAHWFEPAFHFEVGEAWDAGVSVATDRVFLGTGPKGGLGIGPKGGQLIFTTPLHVFDPSNLSEPPSAREDPAPENAAEWASWFQRHPNLDTSKPVQVSVGSAPGVRIDVTESIPENYSRDYWCQQPCVPLYPYGDTWSVSYVDWKYRYVIVDVQGKTVVIDVAAPADKFDEFLPKAQKVLDSVEWKGENSGPS